MRLSRDGGRTYPARYERAIGDHPNQPAAVLIYDKSGAARTFCIDLDVSRGGTAAVERDYRSVSAILSRLGLRYFADRSPNGGIHIYVPLAGPLPYADAAAAARALAARTPTMDPMPMLGIDSGCIRPPGARHKSGGHQDLIGTLSAAYDAIKRRTSPAAWARFVDELDVAAYLVNHSADALSLVNVDDAPQLAARGRWDAPDARYQHIARTGEWDGYRSPSEARQGVIWSCVAAGWSLNDVMARLHDGTWRGLAGMYARYRAGSRHGAILRDWNNAIEFEKSRRQNDREELVRLGTTSGQKTHAGGPGHRWIRTWVTAAHLRMRARRDALATRVVLNALGEAAMKTGSNTVAFGNRSLAEATGLNQATVGKILRALADDADPLITLLDEARSVNAHTWMLIIPDDVAERAHSTPWPSGKIHAIRPAFLELGHAAAFVYAALEQAAGPLTGRELATAAGLGHTTAAEALATLAAFDLARSTGKGWVLGPANIDRLAEQFGVADRIRAVHARHVDDRAAWWAWLGLIRFPRRPNPAQNVSQPDLEPPPEPGWTPMDLVHELLGGHLIEDQPA